MLVLYHCQLWPGLWNIKFAGFLSLQKHIIFRVVNKQSEENFSHNHRINQFIPGWDYRYSGFMAEKYGIAEKGTGEAQDTGWCNPGG